MAFQLYLRVQPRSLYLVSDTHALLFQQPDVHGNIDVSSTKSRKDGPSAIVELIPADALDLGQLIKINKGRSIGGVLGLLSLPIESTGTTETFLVLLASSTTLAPIVPDTHFTPSKVLSVEFHCISSASWDDPFLVPRSSIQSANQIDQSGFEDDGYYESAFSGTRSPPASSSADLLPPSAVIPPANPSEGIKKLLSTGSFYFATNGDWNISRTLRDWDWKRIRKEVEGQACCLDELDDRFVWNMNILQPLLYFRQSLPPQQKEHLDSRRFLIPMIQGFVGAVPLSPSRAPGDTSRSTASLALISRLGWKRAGARFRTRGVDDDGNVANFVETETILAVNDIVMSFLQVRGSVPLFWEQVGNQTFGQKLQITRPQAASQPAFDKHFMDLLDHYGAVHCVNLLGQGENEAILSDIYNAHISSLAVTLESSGQMTNHFTGEEENLVTLTPYDFHASVRVGGHDVVKEDFGRRVRGVRDARERFGWTTIDTTSKDVVTTQSGVFRVNCLDCLDRTNYVEDVIASLTIGAFVASLDPNTLDGFPASYAIHNAHRSLWADNGDALSKIYAGTGALNTSVTRTGKRSIASLLSDASKSVGRAIQATFNDSDKQTSIDLFLGIMAGQQPVRVHDPISDTVNASLTKRLTEYATPKRYTIFAGTWNLCGKPLSGNLEGWLFPQASKQSDLYLVAFQELVPLNAQQILQTDPAARRRTEAALTAAFEQHADDEYVLLRSEQLVGTAIFVYVRATLLPYISRVEGASRKTGLRGMSGNKGGCGIRLDLHDTSICLMTCHLAAGHTNIDERNSDYNTIANGLTFQRGKTIEDHDVVIWAADCNYRINMTNEEVREHVQGNDMQSLWEADQLRSSMLFRSAFPDYDESPITFPPTYKYDIGTDQYDTSEKQRVPAWTDRILRKGKKLAQTAYETADVRTSDHRPVLALYDLTVYDVNQAKRQALLEQLSSNVAVKSLPALQSMDTKVLGRRPPPSVPIKARPSTTNSATVMGGSQKPPPPPRPAKPASLQVRDRAMSSSSLISSSVEDDFFQARSATRPSVPPSNTSRAATMPGPGAILPPPSRTPALPVRPVSSPNAGPQPRTTNQFPIRQSTVANLATNFNTLSDKMYKTTLGTQASGLFNATRSSFGSPSAAPKFIPGASTIAGNTDSRRIPPSLPLRPTPTIEEDNVDVPPHLEGAIRSLLDHADVVRLPLDLRKPLTTAMDGSKGYALVESGSEIVNDNDTNETHDNYASDDNEITTDKYINRQTLSALAKWARQEESLAALQKARLDPYDYHLISLLSGTQTRLSSAHQRLITSNPELSHNYFPPHLMSTKDPDNVTLGAEYRSIRKELAAAANVLFSIGGAGGAVFLVAKSSAGMSAEKAILLALFAALVIAFAEGWLYVSQMKRIESARQQGEQGEQAEGEIAPKPEKETSIADLLEEESAQAQDLAGSMLDSTAGVVSTQSARETRQLRLRRRPVPAV